MSALAPNLPSRGLTALRALNQHLRSVSASPGGNEVAPAPMRSVQRFGRAWSRWASQERMARALQQGPDNAGPLNSHRLAIRALAQVQNASPAYAAHLMAQLDALHLLLQGTAPEAQVKPVTVPTAAPAKARAPRRRRA